MGQVHPLLGPDGSESTDGLDEQIEASGENLRATTSAGDAGDSVTRLLREVRELTAWALAQGEEAIDDLRAAAEREADKTRQTAESEAERIVADARARAEEIIAEAETERDRVQGEVQSVREAIRRLHADRDELEHEIGELSDTRSEAAQELAALKLTVEALLADLSGIRSERSTAEG